MGTRDPVRFPEQWKNLLLLAASDGMLLFLPGRNTMLYLPWHRPRRLTRMHPASSRSLLLEASAPRNTIRMIALRAISAREEALPYEPVQTTELEHCGLVLLGLDVKCSVLRNGTAVAFVEHYRMQHSAPSEHDTRAAFVPVSGRDSVPATAHGFCQKRPPLEIHVAATLRALRSNIDTCLCSSDTRRFQQSYGSTWQAEA